MTDRHMASTYPNNDVYADGQQQSYEMDEDRGERGRRQSGVGVGVLDSRAGGLGGIINNTNNNNNNNNDGITSNGIDPQQIDPSIMDAGPNGDHSMYRGRDHSAGSSSHRSNSFTGSSVSFDPSTSPNVRPRYSAGPSRLSISHVAQPSSSQSALDDGYQDPYPYPDNPYTSSTLNEGPSSSTSSDFNRLFGDMGEGIGGDRTSAHGLRDGDEEMEEDSERPKKRANVDGKATKTCDNCRKRKIKCKEEPPNAGADPLDVSCEGCRKLGIECTFDYVRKRPGRKNTFVERERAKQAAIMGSNSIDPSELQQSTRKDPKPRRSTNASQLPIQDTSPVFAPNPTLAITPTLKQNSLPLAPVASSNYNQSTNGKGNNQQRPNSSFTFSPGKRNADLDLGWLDSLLEGTAVGSMASPGGHFGFGGFSATQEQMTQGQSFQSNGSGSFGGSNNGPMLDWFSDQAHLLQFESPENPMGTVGSAGSTGPTNPPTSSGGLHGNGHSQYNSSGNYGSNGTGGHVVQGLSNMVVAREPQVEDVTSWANITHFISLFLQYLYPLLPLVHRPTFAEHLATRRDLRDSDFRALLLSIVAYVISQLPTTRLVNDQFDIESLKRLQRRCHRTCKVLQKTYYGPTNLTQVTTIIFDVFYLLSIGLGHTAGARLGQAAQLAFTMGLHSDERINGLNLDAIEIQLRRRVFWQLYASDKTRAIPGLPMVINDFQGTCSLPEPIDDEFITSQGMFTQPLTRPSVLCGFVIVSQLFRILSECFFYHRCVATGIKTIPSKWTEKAENRLHKILGDEMPLAIKDPTQGAIGLREVFAMQRANILITAAIVKFALYDLRAALKEVKPDQLTRERQTLAKEMHELLMGIPMEDLASNGESVRGKILHITCALFVQIPPDEQGQQVIKDWWEMFSAISFVQMPAPPEGQEETSRGNTPGPSVSVAPLAPIQVNSGPRS